MGQPLLIFDGDDTLWEVELLYDHALDLAEELVAAAGLPSSEWRALQRTYDLENVRTLGMSPERFPASSLAALTEIARRHGVELDNEVKAQVVAVSHSVFQTRAPLIQGATEVLQELGPTFTLVLLTKGDEEVQRRRIDESGLGDLFDAIEIVPLKDAQTFARILGEFHTRPEDAWSIGNSLPSDINPALSLGMNAIWIDAHVWEHERRDTDVVADEHLVVLEDLATVPDAIKMALERRRS